MSRLPDLGGETHNVWYWPEAGYAFVGEEQFGHSKGPSGIMHVVDLSDMLHPREVATYEVPGATSHNYWLDEDAGMLYLAWYEQGVRMLDVTGELMGRLERQGREAAFIRYGEAGEDCLWDPETDMRVVAPAARQRQAVRLRPEPRADRAGTRPVRRLGGRPVLGGTGAGATARRLATLVPLLLMAACGRSPDRPDGDAPRLYVTSGFTDEVHVLDARDGTILRTIPLDRRRTETDEPHGVTVAPDGRHWYATLAHGHPTLWKYETDGDRLVGRLQLDIPGAARVELTPDGGRAFIPDYWRGGLGEESRVAVVDVHDLTVAAVPVVCPAPHHAAVDPSGTRVAVTCSLSDEIALMEAGSARTLNRLPAGPEPGTAGTPRYAPMNAAWSPDGARFYVTMAGTGEVRAYSRTGDARGAVAVGEGPAQIAASADGRVLVVANRGGASVSVLDPTLLREVRRIELAGAAFPHGIALDRAGEVAYTTWEGRVGEPGGVAALRIGSGEVLWRREVGVLTLGVAYLPGRAEERS